MILDCFNSEITIGRVVVHADGQGEMFVGKVIDGPFSLDDENTSFEVISLSTRDICRDSVEFVRKEISSRKLIVINGNSYDNILSLFSLISCSNKKELNRTPPTSLDIIQVIDDYFNNEDEETDYIHVLDIRNSLRNKDFECNYGGLLNILPTVICYHNNEGKYPKYQMVKAYGYPAVTIKEDEITVVLKNRILG
jgi:hypothetical protein